MFFLFLLLAVVDAQNEAWVLKAHPPPGSAINPNAHLELMEVPVPEVNPGQVLLRATHVTYDASIPRFIIYEDMPAFARQESIAAELNGAVYPDLLASLHRQIGQPLLSNIVAEVAVSQHADYPVGTVLSGFAAVQRFQSYTPDKPEYVRPMSRLDLSVATINQHVGPLAVSTGVTAYLSIKNIAGEKLGSGKPTTVYVSAAAGAVGLYAGQIFKLLGATKVIGSTGSDEKAKRLLELGYDHVINYKTTDLNKALYQVAPEGIDIYFDNVGGRQLEIAIAHMKEFGVLVLCGSISSYNGEEYGVKNMFEVVVRQLRMEGFVVMQWLDQIPDARKVLSGWLKEGKLKTEDTTLTGFDKHGDTFAGLYNGINFGKLILEVEKLPNDEL